MSAEPSRVLRAVSSTPWAILEEKLEEIVEVAELHARGVKLDPAEIAARTTASPRPVTPSRSGGGMVQVLPLYGTIMPRANLLTQYSGGTSAEEFGRAFDTAMASPDVASIVLDVDSPGGAVTGVEELAQKIYAARGKGKRIVAVANYLMASAAYWIASAADEIVASPSAEVGSIGCFMVHTDVSGADEKAGIRRTVIKAGKYKAEGNPYEPLQEEAQTALQTYVREAYDAFVGAVARHRNVSTAAVENGYGQGRALSARRARSAGLVDRVATFEDVLKELTGGKAAPARRARGSTAPTDYASREDGGLDEPPPLRPEWRLGEYPGFALGAALDRERDLPTWCAAHQIAAHEAGHALAFALLGIPVLRVGVDYARAAHGGVTCKRGVCEYEALGHAPEDLLCGTLAGPLAEAILSPWSDLPEGALADSDAELAEHYVECGELDASDVQDAWTNARTLVRRHREAGIALRDALVERGHLSGEEVNAVLGLGPELELELDPHAGADAPPAAPRPRGLDARTTRRSCLY